MDLQGSDVRWNLGESDGFLQIRMGRSGSETWRSLVCLSGRL